MRDGVLRGMVCLALGVLGGCDRSSMAERERGDCLVDAMRATGLKQGVMVHATLDGDDFVVRQQLLPLMGAHAQLPMASLTKPLVAWQVRQQIQAGRMRLDQPIGELMPASAHAQSITVQHLLQHQAGFDRSVHDPLFWPGPPSCRRAAADVLSRPAELPVGGQVVYSNAGYCVLGEVLLRHGWGGALTPVLAEPLGAAGAWQGSVDALSQRLLEQLPLAMLPSAQHLPDGSHYAYGWRYWPQRTVWRWTHYGRLPGMVSIAASDGAATVLVVHFSGDPPDYEAVAVAYLEQVQRCLV